MIKESLIIVVCVFSPSLRRFFAAHSQIYYYPRIFAPKKEEVNIYIYIYVCTVCIICMYLLREFYLCTLLLGQNTFRFLSGGVCFFFMVFTS